MPRNLKASTSLAGDFAGLRLQIEYVPIDSLVVPANALREHKQYKLKKLGRSIKDFGFLIPLVCSADNVIATGSARLAAAKAIGLREVPIVRAHHLTNEQLRLLRIADNKLTEGSEWNIRALAIEFAEIAIAAPGLDQDSSAFSITERDIIFGRQRVADETDLDDVVKQTENEPTARVGDIFNLGRHVVSCGDATSLNVIASVARDRRVRTVASDLPFNVKIAGNVSGMGANKHGEFAMASGEMSKAQFIEFLVRAIAATKGHLLDGALLYLFMDWRHIGQLIAAGEASDLDYLNLLIWAKTNAGMGSFYRSAYEMIGLFKHGDAPHTNNVQLGRDGRSRSNLVSYPGVNTFTKGRNKALSLHPTVKPVALMADLILDSSAPGELILDPFGGSGTTLIAAERTDRTAALVEIDPGYVDVIVRRFEDATGEQATLASTGQTFAELAEQRQAGEV